MIARENYEGIVPERARIIWCAVARAKKVVLLESREIALVASLGQIMNIGSSHARKLQKERSREGRDISMHDKLLEKGCRLRVALNRTGSIFTPNNEY